MEPSAEEIEMALRERYKAVNETRRKIGLEPIAYDSNPEAFYCSFCGKEPEEVKSMVEGVGVYICDVCVIECHDLLHQEAE